MSTQPDPLQGVEPPNRQALLLILIALIVALLGYRFMRWKAMPRFAADPPVMRLTQADAITAVQCREGILAVGATGSGKSSSLMHMMAAFMRRKAGMLVLTAGISDYDDVLRLARKCGRESDVRRFSPDEPWRLDWLSYEISSPGGSVASASQLVQDLVDYSAKTQTQNSTDMFFPMASARGMRMGITMVHGAKGKCSIADLYNFMTTLPATKDEFAAPEFKQSFCGQCLMEAAAKSITPDVELAGEYVLREWPRTGEKTQGSIQAQTMNVLEKFMSGHVRELVASGVTNLSPQDVLDGRIVVVDLPVLKYREPGQFVQIIWKLLTQRAVLRRPPSESNREIVLWADEAQLHAVQSDSMVQAVARKHKLISVAITQNLPLLFSVLKNRDDAIAWISNLQTKLIFANGDRETNEYFSALCGSSKHLFGSSSVQDKPYDYVGDMLGTIQGGNYSMSEQLQADIPAWEFPTFRKGGRENNYIVDCVCFQGGRVFSNGKTWVKASIKQMI